MDKKLRFFCALFLSFLLGLGAVGCLVSAFALPVSLWTVGFWCAVSALVCAVAFSKNWGFAPWILWLMAAICLVRNGTVLQGFEALVHRLSTVYNGGYGWKIIKWSAIEPKLLDAYLPGLLCLFGGFLVLLTVWAVGKEQSVAPALVLAVFLIAPCFVVTDKVPATAWVFLVFFVGALLLLASATTQMHRFLALAAAPVCLAVLLLFAFVPKNGYNGDVQAEKILEDWRILEFWDRLTGSGSGLASNGTRVDLRQVDNQSYMDVELMTVKSPVDTVLYLRGRTLDVYDGITWTDSGNKEILHWPYAGDISPTGSEVEITTRYAHRMLYLPYYTTSLDILFVLCIAAGGVLFTKLVSQCL